jgi:hypothetical protein
LNSVDGGDLGFAFLNTSSVKSRGATEPSLLPKLKKVYFCFIHWVFKTIE